MDAAKQIQIAVAKADLIICEALRWMAVIVPLSVVLLIVFLTARRLSNADRMNHHDAPEAAITNRGYSDAWREFGGD